MAAFGGIPCPLCGEHLPATVAFKDRQTLRMTFDPAATEHLRGHGDNPSNPVPVSENKEAAK